MLKLLEIEMICILSFDEKKNIKGWIIAVDGRDAWRQANAAAIGEGEDSPAFKLLEALTALTGFRETIQRPGKRVLPSGHLMLVS